MRDFREYNFHNFNGYDEKKIMILKDYLVSRTINNLEEAYFLLEELNNNKEFYKNFLEAERHYYKDYIRLALGISLLFYSLEVYAFLFVRNSLNLLIILTIALTFPKIISPLCMTLSTEINFQKEFKNLKKPLEEYITQNDKQQKEIISLQITSSDLRKEALKKDYPLKIDYSRNEKYVEIVAFYQMISLNWEAWDLEMKRNYLEQLFLMIKLLKKEEEKKESKNQILILKKANKLDQME